MKIIAAGDFFPGGDLFYKNKDYEIFSQNIQSIFEDADLRLVNLEGPLIKKFDNSDSPFPKKLLQGIPEEMVFWLKKHNIDFVSLANNHIFDYGERGLTNTIKVLEDNNIKYSGVGSDLSEAREPAFFQEKGKKISVHSYSEYEKPYLNKIIPASQNSYGVSTLDLEKLKEDVENFDSDIKIAFIHWGREHFYHPDPKEQVNKAKKIIDLGFDIILGAHSHYPQRVDMYKGKPIAYSMGNFLFPNFYYKEPAQICYPDENEVPEDIHSTLDLPIKPGDLLYKKWRKNNRESLICEMDINEGDIEVEKHYCFQLEEEPFLEELSDDERKDLEKKLYQDIDFKKEMGKWKRKRDKRIARQICFERGYLAYLAYWFWIIFKSLLPETISNELESKLRDIYVEDI